VQPPVSQPAGAAFDDDACKPGTVKTGMINNIMVCDTNAGNIKKALFADSVNIQDSFNEIKIMKKLADKCKGTSPHLGCSHVARIVSHNTQIKRINRQPGFTMTMTKYELGAVAGYMQKLKREEILVIADHILRGLAYLWEVHGLGHCDMKPDNVFLTKNLGTPPGSLLAVVGDFGTVTPLGALQTNKGVTGTYADPRYLHRREQQQPLPMTKNRDMFAYVLTVYDMVNGRSQRSQKEGGAEYADISQYDYAMWNGQNGALINKILGKHVRRNLVRYYPMGTINGYGIPMAPMAPMAPKAQWNTSWQWGAQ
jgi:serine/threonine protein kinase